MQEGKKEKFLSLQRPQYLYPMYVLQTLKRYQTAFLLMHICTHSSDLIPDEELISSTFDHDPVIAFDIHDKLYDHSTTQLNHRRGTESA